MILKLVYFGPALSGKTANLLQLHKLLKQQRCDELMMLDIKDDRTMRGEARRAAAPVVPPRRQ